MSDFGADGDAGHRDGESDEPACPHQRLDGPFAGLMEKNMSKGNDSSKLGRATQVRELRDDELENVSGGWLININTADEAQLTSIVVTKPTDVASWSLGASNI
jgi:hypothetical protein